MNDKTVIANNFDKNLRSVDPTSYSIVFGLKL